MTQEPDPMNAFVRPARNVFLPIDEIDLSHAIRPYNATVVAELAQSIRAIGLQTPLTCIVRDGKHILVAGRNRLEALRTVGAEEAPVRIVEFDDVEAQLWRLSENLHRAELTKLEYDTSTNPRDVKELAEATADLKEARERVRTILDAKWPKAPNALSRRLRELGPQLRGVGIHISWPNSHKDAKVLTVTNDYFDLPKEETRETSSSSSYRTPPTDDDGRDRDNCSSLDDDAQPSDEPWARGEGSAEHRPWDGPPSFDPDFMPDEPTCPSDGPVGSTKSDGAYLSEGGRGSGLREDEGFEI
jgi:ParB-like nuclease domain